jgi:uncharacterized repeat protein (TIGR01451 family)
LWTVGTVGTGGPQTLIINARVDSPGALTNTAAISHADQFDPNTTNNSASATETPQQADLLVSKSVSNATPNVGDTITFTVTLSDQGPDAATNVVVNDLLPAGLTILSATPSQGTYSSGLWTVGTVSTATPQTLAILARVDSPGALTNTAAISHADQFDPNTTNNSASATETPLLTPVSGPNPSPPPGPNPFANTDWNVATVGDFNGDAMADLAWVRQADHLAELQFFNGITAVGGGVIANNPFDMSWNIVAEGDFNGDGKTDLAWQRQSDGLAEIQLLNGTTGIGGGTISNNVFGAGWNVAGAGDFNGDGKADLVWRRASDGLTEVQFLNGNRAVGGGAIANNPFDMSWNIVAKGDFNGDGKTDLVWQRQSDGLAEIQLLNGTTGIGGGTISNNAFGAGWNVAGAGDFNGDGKADLVWRRASDGLTEIQFLNGNTAVGGGAIANNAFDASWNVAGVGDFNGDGMADLVWRRASDGLIGVQFMNGNTAIGGGIMGADPDVHVSQMVQAMSSFSPDPPPLSGGASPSLPAQQEQLLTTPQHA